MERSNSNDGVFIKKEKLVFYIHPQDIGELDNFISISPYKSRSEFIVRAIHFYGGYLRSTSDNRYLPLAIESSLKGIVDVSEDRIARLLFKLAVELSMAMNVLASTCEIDEETLKNLRGKCIQDIKKSVGNIDLSEIIKYQNRGK